MKDIPIFMQEPCSSPPRLKKLFNKWRASERIDGPPAVADDLIPAFPSEITSEHEEDNIDRKLVDHYVVFCTVSSVYSGSDRVEAL